jgi:hypothetical protein
MLKSMRVYLKLLNLVVPTYFAVQVTLAAGLACPACTLKDNAQNIQNNQKIPETHRNEIASKYNDRAGIEPFARNTFIHPQ